jgi:two-component system chemotaxis response regulator CheB
MKHETDARKRIEVLVVEDSPVIREFLVHILNSDPEIQVVATAGNGEEALEAVVRHKPQVITMDVHMPRLNGLEATRRIMETNATPIVIVTGSSDPAETELAFRGTEAGALAVIGRPAGFGHPEHEFTAAQLIRTVKLMSEVKVVRRWTRLGRRSPVAPTLPPPRLDAQDKAQKIKLVAIGASTGGPAVLRQILAELPEDFPVPVLVVQHIAPGFVEGLVHWLSQSSRLSVHVAAQGEPIFPGHAYFAPDGWQMKVEGAQCVSLIADEPNNGLCPSVSHLFRSVAETFGKHAVGVLLTGMGKDGAEELKLMRDLGAVTIAQDEESCVVFGMPGEAVSLGAATYVLSPKGIAAALAALVKKIPSFEEAKVNS